MNKSTKKVLDNARKNDHVGIVRSKDDFLSTRDLQGARPGDLVFSCHEDQK